MRTSSLWLIAACLAVGIAVPLVLGAAGDGSSTHADNRARIAAMSAGERDELQQKYNEYRALPEAEREKYRRLHAQIESNPQLEQVFVEFRRWLRTLSPWQRQELQGEHDWSQRLEIVRQIREQQKDATDQRRTRDRARWLWMRPLVPLSHVRGFPKLERHDLASIMKLIEDSVPKSSEFERQLQNTGGSAAIRYVRVLTQALRQASTGTDQPSSDLDWPDRLLMERIEKSITDEHDRDRYDDLRRRIDPEGQRLLLAVIAHGIDSQAWDEAREAKPNKDDLVRLFDSIEDSGTKQRFQYLSAPEREGRLRWMYMGERRKPFREEAQELSRMLDQWLPQPPPPERGGSGGSPRRDGDRGDDRGSRRPEGRRELDDSGPER